MTAGIVAAAAIVVAALSLCGFLVWLVKEQADRRCLDLTERLITVEASRDTMIIQIAAQGGVAAVSGEVNRSYTRTVEGVEFGDGTMTDLQGRPLSVEHVAPRMKDAPLRDHDPMYRKILEEAGDEDWSKVPPEKPPLPEGVI